MDEVVRNASKERPSQTSKGGSKYTEAGGRTGGEGCQKEVRNGQLFALRLCSKV